MASMNAALMDDLPVLEEAELAELLETVDAGPVEALAATVVTGGEDDDDHDATYVAGTASEFLGLEEIDFDGILPLPDTGRDHAVDDEDDLVIGQSPADAAAVATIAAPAASVSGVRKTSRQRQREELEHLRRQVLELEDELSQIKGPAETATKNEKGEEELSVAIWENIAKRQLSAKHRAEVENARLRELLVGQLKIARGLEKLLRKRPPTTVAGMDNEAKRRRRLSSLGTSLYEELASKLEQRYLEMESAFVANGLAANKGDHQDAHVMTCPNSGELFVEVQFAKVYPFDFEATRDAVWRCATKSYLELTNGYYAGSADSDTDIHSRFEIPLQIRRVTVNFQAEVAMKRFLEGHREVYAYEAYTKISAPNTAYDGVVIVDHGWTCVERLPTADPFKPATVVQSCSRVFPGSQHTDDESQVGVLNDVLIASFNQNFHTLTQTVENILLENSLGINRQDD